MKTNLIVAGFGILFGALVFLLIPHQAGRDGHAAVSNIQSAAFFPLLLSILLVVVSAAFFISTLFGSKHPAPVADDGANTTEGQVIEAPLRLAATAVSLVLYYFFLNWAGMVAASVVMIFGLSWVLGFRNYWLAAAIAVAVPFGVYLLFQRALYVMLPEGRLF